MANEKNLKPFDSVNVAREMQKKSVQKRAENKQKKRILAETIQERLTDEDYIAIIDNLIQRAITTDKGFEILRDTLGQKPKCKIQTSQEEPFEITIKTI